MTINFKTQLQQNHQESIDIIAACIGGIDEWMSSNRLNLNSDKTQDIWLGSRQQIQNIEFKSASLGSDTVAFQSWVIYIFFYHI